MSFKWRMALKRHLETGNFPGPMAWVMVQSSQCPRALPGRSTSRRVGKWLRLRPPEAEKRHLSRLFHLLVMHFCIFDTFRDPKRVSFVRPERCFRRTDGKEELKSNSTEPKKESGGMLSLRAFKSAFRKFL